MASMARCIYDIPSRNPDLYYAIRFDMPDPCLLFEHRGQRALILSDLEFDRGVREADVDEVLPLKPLQQRAKQQFGNSRISDIIRLLCRERQIRKVEMPGESAALIVERLRKARLQVTLQSRPFYPARMIKTPEELREIRAAQQATFRAINTIEKILRRSRIRRDRKLAYQGKLVTSESLKAAAQTQLYTQGYALPDGLIVSCGDDSIEGHNRGSGPMLAHEAIVVDIFPRALDSLYYGDATRTFCKGAPRPELQAMFNCVKRAQTWALRTIKAGMNGRTIHRGIEDIFADAGYVTGAIDGTLQGFSHGTGHGIGLDLHEEPLRISKCSCTLKAGHVVTVEPGLYYKDIGGVRIEDTVVVTKTGCRALGTYPKKLSL
jgi:Xaa-Pro aminopeptidase